MSSPSAIRSGTTIACSLLHSATAKNPTLATRLVRVSPNHAHTEANMKIAGITDSRPDAIGCTHSDAIGCTAKAVAANAAAPGESPNAGRRSRSQAASAAALISSALPRWKRPGVSPWRPFWTSSEARVVGR